MLFSALLGAAAVAFAADAVDMTSPCSKQPAGYGPVPSPNTAAAFKTYAAFANASTNAATPALYQRTFVNLNASEFASSSNVYLGYYELKSYDAASCTAICDQTSGCVGTNLYFERSPSQLPAANCSNPPAITLIKCALWGSPVTAEQATNDGQFQQNFRVLIAGSNGYMKLPSQACSAISSAWFGAAYSFPTGYNAQAWTSSYGSQYRTASTWPSSAMAGPAGY